METLITDGLKGTLKNTLLKTGSCPFIMGFTNLTAEIPVRQINILTETHNTPTATTTCSHPSHRPLSIHIDTRPEHLARSWQDSTHLQGPKLISLLSPPPRHPTVLVGLLVSGASGCDSTFRHSNDDNAPSTELSPLQTGLKTKQEGISSPLISSCFHHSCTLLLLRGSKHKHCLPQMEAEEPAEMHRLRDVTPTADPSAGRQELPPNNFGKSKQQPEGEKNGFLLSLLYPQQGAFRHSLEEYEPQKSDEINKKKQTEERRGKTSKGTAASSWEERLNPLLKIHVLQGLLKHI